MSEKTTIGLEVFQNSPDIGKDWGRCAYLCNHASYNLNWEHGVDVLDRMLGERFTTIFGPQHGFLGTAQDNMIETNHTKHSSGRKIYSLYSEAREPTEAMLADVDTIIVDLQNVGCRVYTFKSTLAGCLRSAKKFDKKVVVLDRPNPVGGKYIEGRCVEEAYKSFVGQFIMPMRHGLTIGEVGHFFNLEIQADLEVVSLQNWDPNLDWRFTKRPWILTSPNLPTLEPVFVYPGTVIFEGCNVSEGRGTGLPFQLFGSPYCKSPQKVIKRFYDYYKDYENGIHLREAQFEPTSGKWMNQVCQGVQIHVTKPEKVFSYHIALSLLKSFWDESPHDFKFQEPPYEYEYEKLPMSIILGGEMALDSLENYAKEDEYWSWGNNEFLEKVKPLLIYPREQCVV